MDRITVLVRSASATRLPMLELALASLAGQSWTGIEVLVMLQSPDADFAAGVQAAIRRIAWPATTTARAIAVAVEAGVDGRSRLMNAGAAAAAGRYLAFLDDDDIVYPQAYARLIGRLRANPAAVMAAGGCAMMRVWQTHDGLLVMRPEPWPYGRDHIKFDLLMGNFIPIHSYVIDLERFPKALVAFHDAAVPLEDFDFLLRLAGGGAFDLSLTDEPMCEYRLHGGNTIWAAEGDAIPTALHQAVQVMETVVARTALTITRAEWREVLARQNRPPLLAEQAAGPRPADPPQPEPDPEPAPMDPPEPEPAPPTLPKTRFLHRRADDAYRLMEATGPVYRGLASLYMMFQRWRRG